MSEPPHVDIVNAMRNLTAADAFGSAGDANQMPAGRPDPLSSASANGSQFSKNSGRMNGSKDLGLSKKAIVRRSNGDWRKRRRRWKKRRRPRKVQKHHQLFTMIKSGLPPRFKSPKRFQFFSWLGYFCALYILTEIL